MYLKVKTSSGINVQGDYPEQMVIIGSNDFPVEFLGLMELFRHSSVIGVPQALDIIGWEGDCLVHVDRDFLNIEDGFLAQEYITDSWRHLTTHTFPESGISPLKHWELGESLLLNGAVFITTASPQLLNGVPLEKIFIFHDDGTLTCAKDNASTKRLVEEGDLPGSLWIQGLLIP